MLSPTVKSGFYVKFGFEEVSGTIMLAEGKIEGVSHSMILERADYQFTNLCWIVPNSST